MHIQSVRKTMQLADSLDVIVNIEKLSPLTDDHIALSEGLLKWSRNRANKLWETFTHGHTR